MTRGVARNLSRGQRRLLVAAIYLGLVVYTSIFSVVGDSWWLLAGLLGFVTTIAIHSWLLAPFTQRIADKKENDLDERQLAIRNHAHRTAYQILAAMVMLALLYIQVNLAYFDGRLWTLSVTDQNISYFLVGAIWLVITLPTSIIAWKEPDPEREEIR